MTLKSIQLYTQAAVVELVFFLCAAGEIWSLEHTIRFQTTLKR